jgi:hypothetical protein
MPGPPGLVAFDLTFRISPIILTGGIAGAILGGAVPIINYLQPTMFTSLVDSGTGDLTLDQFFAHFQPLPGATLGENDIGRYPFANQTIAANAIIFQPLRVSLLMICPVNPPNTYAQKYAVMTALQATLQQHDLMGGLYTVATPAFTWQNCIRLRIVDVSRGETNQPQITWQWDFEQPQIAVSAAQGAYNNMLGKIAAQTPLGPNPAGQIPTSGFTTTVGGDSSATAPATAVPSIAPLGGNLAPSGSQVPINQDWSSGPPSNASSSAPLPDTLTIAPD